MLETFLASKFIMYLRKHWLLVLMSIGLTIYAAAYMIQGHKLDNAKKEVKELSKALDQSEAENKTLRKVSHADNAAGEVKTRIVHDIIIKEEKGRAVTQKALDNNPQWRDQPIPADVLGSLQQ